MLLKQGGVRLEPAGANVAWRSADCDIPRGLKPRGGGAPVSYTLGIACLASYESWRFPNPAHLACLTNHAI